MSSTENTKQVWIEKGYEHFALYGPENLSINKLSKSMGLSRASFYHYFGEIGVFTEELLTRHWQIIHQFNTLGKEKCTHLFPDLYELLEQYPVPLQFSLQLFHHRSTPAYNFILIKSYEATARSFALKLFVNHFDLIQSESEIYHLWLTLGEAWYSRLDPNDLTSTTLQKHSEEILQTLSAFVSSPLFARLRKSE